MSLARELLQWGCLAFQRTLHTRAGASNCAAMRKTKPVQDRFWAKVQKQTEVTSPNVTTPCWLWTGARIRKGYGVFWLNGKNIRASHFTSGRTTEEIVMHKCDNPPCVNPDHLIPSTQKRNMQDCVEKGRQRNTKKTHCIRGHDLSGDNLKIDNLGRRVCVECKKAKDTKSRNKKKAFLASQGGRYRVEYVSRRNGDICTLWFENFDDAKNKSTALTHGGYLNKFSDTSKEKGEA